ncbi:PSP1 domain-containing protein [Spraguea lophii 42_110]|uniref:PSP1 domain-containing protein n=1 Tax=Spraguea lophii (strain 42_110) TaxID=1358809 RepID=S7W829_SPRLO|nr:PSP1 domain-containing protein [Spraguea lophii 42_110]
MTLNNGRWYSTYVDNIWPENRKWKNEDWRIVGSMPFSDPVEEEDAKIDYNDLNELLTRIDERLYIIEFGNLRLDIGYSLDFQIQIGDYVILEADRGEDCGKVVSFTTKSKYVQLIDKIDKNNVSKEIHPKKIYRVATKEDITIIHQKKHYEIKALSRCIEKVTQDQLPMNVVDCEYQWDMNKLTFFFMSKEKVDFRELVKNLYKEYKIRIWMCSVEKSNHHILKELIE